MGRAAIYGYISTTPKKCENVLPTKADWAKRWPACGLYGKPVHQQTVSDTAKQIFARIGIAKEDNSPIEGQISMEAIDND